VANQGELEKRLREFIRGLKQVHVSTFGPAPIAYRRDRNLLDFDEKMAVLVQKVIGRGSNDIDLGVRVGYGDINHTLVLGEIAFDTAGVTPEVSFGTHFFNDLVEAEIAPIAIYPDEANSIFREGILLGAPNELASLSPELARYGDVLHAVHLPSQTGGRLLHVLLDGEEGRGVGFLAHPQEPENSRPNGENRHVRTDPRRVEATPATDGRRAAHVNR
jgi:hypothetical protein